MNRLKKEVNDPELPVPFVSLSLSSLKNWTRIISSPTIVVLLLSLTLVVINLYITQYTRPYISDDVSWQTTLLTWFPFKGHVADVGATDNFLVNVPVIALFSHLFSPSRTLIFAEATFFAVINFVLFYTSALYFMRKGKIELSYASLAPFLWLSSFGYAFASLFLNLAWRDFEIGVAFIYFMLVMKLYYDEINPLATWRSKTLTGLSVLFAGIEVYSDPYFLYFVVIPIVLLYMVLLIYKLISRRIFTLVLASALVSIVISRMLSTVMAHAGLFSPEGGVKQGALYSLRNIHVLLDSLHSSLVDMFTIFGINTLGLHIADFTLVGAIMNLFVFILIVVLACWAVYKSLQNRKKLVVDGRVDPTFLVVIFFILLSVFAITADTAYDPETYRYMVIMVFSMVLVLALIISKLRRIQYALSALVLLATVFNIGWAVTNMTVPKENVADNVANNSNYKVVETINHLGLTKGYTSYWDGNINTYLSGGKIKFLPVTCLGNSTKPLRLLVDTTLFNQPSSKSFYIYDPSQVPSSMCVKNEVMSQFGKPQQTLYAQGRTVYVYDYDIVSKM